jgi:hypothetical protein
VKVNIYRFISSKFQTKISEETNKNNQNMSSTKNKSPDLSFMRYQFDEFKNTKAREVPFEEVDYSIYKASSNCIAFKTSEKRIGTWIKTDNIMGRTGCL